MHSRETRVVLGQWPALRHFPGWLLFENLTRLGDDRRHHLLASARKNLEATLRVRRTKTQRDFGQLVFRKEVDTVHFKDAELTSSKGQPDRQASQLTVLNQ